MNGILFKPDMIRAIVEDRKTQTRRVIKPQPIESVAELKEHSQLKGYFIPYASDKRMVNRNAGTHKNDCGYVPEYKVGEVVYIKEAWATENKYNYLKTGDIPRDAALCYFTPEYDYDPLMGRQRSPLFLMEWMARYFIQITDVRPERLQEITLTDIYDEGIDVVPSYDRIDAYKRLWDSINPKYPWTGNWWIWRYEFKKVEKCPTI